MDELYKKLIQKTSESDLLQQIIGFYHRTHKMKGAIVFYYVEDKFNKNQRYVDPREVKEMIKDEGICTTICNLLDTYNPEKEIVIIIKANEEYAAWLVRSTVSSTRI